MLLTPTERDRLLLFTDGLSNLGAFAALIALLHDSGYLKRSSEADVGNGRVSVPLGARELVSVRVRFDDGSPLGAEMRIGQVQDDHAGSTVCGSRC